MCSVAGRLSAAGVRRIHFENNVPRAPNSFAIVRPVDQSPRRRIRIGDGCGRQASTASFVSSISQSLRAACRVKRVSRGLTKRRVQPVVVLARKHEPYVCRSKTSKSVSPLAILISLTVALLHHHVTETLRRP